MTAEVIIGLLGVGALSTTVLIAVGKNLATVSHIKDKINCIDTKLKEVRDVMISMPCTEYNGKIKVIPGFSQQVSASRAPGGSGIRMNPPDVGNRGTYDFKCRGFK